MRPFPKSRTAEILSILLRHRCWKTPSPRELRLVLEELGPLYMKLGQIMCVRSELLPEEYCQELMLLRGSAEPIPFDYVKNILADEYTGSWETVFSEFCPEPLGAASVAQVHKAILYDGSVVAVKVQRPDSLSRVQRDIRLLRRLSCLSWLTPARGVANMGMMLDELWASAQIELDFIQEANNINRFAALPWESSYAPCPKVYSELCTKHVLVMEYIDGVRCDDLAALTDKGYDFTSLCRELVQSYTLQIFRYRFFHADPHLCNIMYANRRLVWIDFGIMGEVTEEQCRYFANGIRAVVFSDAKTISSILLDMGGSRPGADAAGLEKAVQKALEIYRSKSLGELDLRTFLSDFLAAARSCGVTMPTGVTMLTRSILALEGTIRILCGSTDPTALLSLVAASLPKEYTDSKEN